LVHWQKLRESLHQVRNPRLEEPSVPLAPLVESVKESPITSEPVFAPAEIRAILLGLRSKMMREDRMQKAHKFHQERFNSKAFVEHRKIFKDVV
jgi:hypothetical protein